MTAANLQRSSCENAIIGIERKIARQAIEETRDDLGLKQNIGNKISFAELNDLLRKHYAEADSSIVWNRFYKQAPFVENKKELFRGDLFVYRVTRKL